MTTAALREMRGRYRLLVILAASGDDPALAEQVRLLEDQRAGVEERRLLVLPLVPGHPAQLGDRRLDPGTVAEERARLDAGTMSTAVLIGLDGNEARRFDVPVDPGTVFEVIDAMPMRRQELRDQRS